MSERTSHGGRDDWRVRVVTGVAVAVCMWTAMLLGPMVGIHGLVPGMIAVAVAVVVGTLLGQFLGSRLFRSTDYPAPPTK